MLICPKCGLALSDEGASARCPEGHSFDRARQGYWNLLMDSSSHGHGDDREMLLSRRAFLDAGYYRHLAERIALCAEECFPMGGTLVDAGCGEGYYTDFVTRRLESAGRSPRLFAFDIAKEAVKMTAGRRQKNGVFFVASAFHIPMARESADLILSLFAPYAEEEYLRVLKPGGILIRAVPLEKHLFRLKQAVYDVPSVNEKKAAVSASFSILKEQELKEEITLSSPEAVRALFGMTPYAKKTGQREKARLDAVTELTVETHFGVIVYQKKDKISLE